MVLFRTHVAPLLTSTGQPIKGFGPEPGPICWLDELLHGGLRRPDGLRRPLVVLLSGPPGAGKSLLTQQMLWSSARETIGEHPDAPGQWLRGVLLSTETPAAAIAENLWNLGYGGFDEGKQVFWASSYHYDPGKPLQQSAAPADQSGLMPTLTTDSPGTSSLENAPPVTGVVDAPMIILSPDRSGEPEPWTYQSFIDQIMGCWKLLSHTGCNVVPDVLAIDSVNVLPERLERRKERGRTECGGGHQKETEIEQETDSVAVVYDKLLQVVGNKLKVMVLVVDTPSSSPASSTEHRYWEYVADVIIKLDSAQLDDSYHSQWLEIVKTRFQPHTLGRQLVKIFPFQGTVGDKVPVIDKEGARPHLVRGGVFVYPSEHYILSRIRTGQPLITSGEAPQPTFQLLPERRKDGEPAPSGPLPRPRSNDSSRTPPPPAPEASLNWPVPWCYELVGGGGVPLRSTTAIMGRRGAHKSHFAYQFILDGVANDEHTLTISFRDNPDNVYATLGRISRAPQYSSCDLGRAQIEHLNRVLYQRPGYVTPQEFLHRLIAEVGEHHPSRVMVGAIDQWSTAYPLLAKSSIVLPTIIDFLNTHGAASMIIGVEGESRTMDWSGLTSRAEVVLAFEYVAIDWVREADEKSCRRSKGYAIDGYPKDVLMRTPPPSGGSGTYCQPKVVARAVRVPHGRAGLARAAVEYECESAERNAPAGLRLIPLAPEYPVGQQL